MAFCNIDENIYQIVKKPIEDEFKHLLFDIHAKSFCIKEKKFKLIGKLIVVEYELNNCIINIVNEFRNHIIKTVIIECKKLYFNNIEDNISNKFFLVINTKKNEDFIIDSNVNKKKLEVLSKAK
jgi:hypothetical protein